MLANELYAALLGPVETLVKDKRTLLVVPSGALTALPFHLLVTEKPPAAIPETFDGYREAAWLLKRQAVSVLPSVASLKALRAFARKDQGIKPMIGFGNPLFNPAQRNTGDQRAASASEANRSVARGVTDPAAAHHQAIVALGNAVKHQALVMGFSDTFGVIGVVLVIAAVAVLFTRKAKVTGGGAGAH